MLRRLSAFVAGVGFVLVHGLSVAAPEGGNIVSGSGSIDKEGSKTTINQYSPDIVVDWDSFNVAENEMVHFEQSSARDSALNRIYDANPSEIWGKVTARGNVWLLNPNGVFFSRTSQVAVGSLVAAGLWMDKGDFMRGRYVLSAERGVGNVSNAGAIAATGGGVALLGRQVSNSGSIRAKASRVTLASGDRIAVDFDGDGLLRFQVDSLPEQGTVSNDGLVESGEIVMTAQTASGVFAGVVNNGGILRAGNVDGSGGVIRLAAEQVEHSGAIDASAAGAAAGGQVSLEAGEQLVVGGTITVAAIAGIDIDPVAMRGGLVELLGQSVLLSGDAAVDASGRNGGGTVLVGGDWQGGNPQVRNADSATVEEGARVLANAVDTGDGGKVVVWSDGTTAFHGEIEAKGGAEGGDGGQVEVSGKQHLLMRGTADTRAPKGETGLLLLDPGTVTICEDGAGGCMHDGTDTFSDTQIVTMLGMSDVTIATEDASTGEENINVDSGVSISWSANALTLNAGNDISLGGALAPSGTATLALNFGNMLSLGSATLSGSISATGGGSGSILAGPAGDTTWSIINGGRVTVGGVMMTLSDVGILRGGAGVDTFSVNGASSYNLEGGGGADQFVIDAALTGSIDGGADGDTFTLNNMGSVSVGIDGGAGADTFNLEMGGSVSGGLAGGAGDDTFDFDGGTVTGTVAGGVGSDTFDFAGASATNAVTVSLTGTSASDGVNPGDPPVFDGFDGNASGAATVTFTGADSLTGTGQSDTLQGLDVAATWNLGSGDSYVVTQMDPVTMSMVSRTLTFSSFESFTAGAAADTFVVERAYTGTLDGGAGDDVFRLASGGAITGGLTGGAGADTFDFDGGTVSGTVAGGGDGDTLDFAGVSTDLTVTLSGTPDADGFDGSVSGGAVVSSFTGINTVTGGSGTGDALAGLDMDAAWTTSSYALTVAGTARTLAFSAVEDLQGGSMADTFTVSMAHSGDLTGGDGADEFTLTAALTGSMDGGIGDDTFNLNTNGSVSGGITGGAGADTFDFNGGTVTGTVAGGADSDTIDFADATAAVTVELSGTPDTDGFDGTAAGGASATFSGVNTLAGGGNDGDTLSGLDAMSTWTLGTNDSYESNSQTLAFSDIEHMQGGSMVDEFTVSDAHTGNLMGGGGADEFTLTAALTGAVSGEGGGDTFNLGAGGSVSGTVDGGAGSDTLSYSTRSTTVAVTVSAMPVADGFAGTATDTGGFADISVVTGGSATNDSFTGASDGSLSGSTYSVNALSLTVNSFESLGIPELTGTNAATTWTIDGSTVTADVGGVMTTYNNVTSVQGGSMVDTFNVTGNTTVTLNGGGGNDVFNFQGADVTGTSVVAGEGGSDTLNFSHAMNTAIIQVMLTGNSGMDGADGFAGNVSGGRTVASFTGADVIIGTGVGGMSDVLQGLNMAGTWTLGASDSYAVMVNSNSRSLGFSAIENIQGGTDVDTFSVGAHSGNLLGGGGADVFTVAGTLTGSIDGGAGADDFNLDAMGSVSMGITGGAGDDTFDFNGGTVSGTVAGGADSDTLDFADATAAVTVELSGTPDTDGFDGTAAGGASATFSGVNTLTGGGNDGDTLSGLDAVSTWTLDTNDSYLSNSPDLGLLQY